LTTIISLLTEPLNDYGTNSFNGTLLLTKNQARIIIFISSFQYFCCEVFTAVVKLVKINAIASAIFLKGIFGRNKLNRIRETYHANALDINASIPPVKSLRHIKLVRFFF
jgi:hypothetical protein